MHILYVDDSGDVENSEERHFILGGLAVSERNVYHLITTTDACVAKFGLGDPSDIELHGSVMYSGRSGVWAGVKKRADREGMMGAALAAFEGAARLFAVAVDKEAVSPADPIAIAFEEICNRFNLFLQRKSDRTRHEMHRGLIVMDESKHERPLQALARHFRVNGSRWGRFRHLVEVPLFVDSRASRLVQLADLVAYATWRKYEFSDGRFFDPLIPRFDAEGGIIHGLVHRRSARDCYCPACHSRRLAPRTPAPTD